MLTRFHADNFKCLQNFTIEFDTFTLLTGPNGSGKSTVLEALRSVANLLAQRGNLETLFPTASLTRWDNRAEQVFEVDVRTPNTGEGAEALAGGNYHYALRIGYDRLRRQNRVVEERLAFEDKDLYRASLDPNTPQTSGAPSFRAQLFKDSGQRGPEVMMDWLYSGVARIQEVADNRLLQRFRRFFNQLVILGINPDSVSAETRADEPMIDFNGGNFAGWLLHLLSAEGLACREAERSLKDGLLPELALFQLEAEGSLRIAKAVFQVNGKEIKLRLDELSAGQRAIVILEHALAVAKTWGGTLIIDEPANFLGLTEIQPLLHRLHDAGTAGQLQAIITSHHPMSIDLFAEQAGRWLERAALGPTRCHQVAERVERLPDSAMPLSEMVARGWAQTG